MSKKWSCDNLSLERSQELEFVFDCIVLHCLFLFLSLLLAFIFFALLVFALALLLVFFLLLAIVFIQKVEILFKLLNHLFDDRGLLLLFCRLRLTNFRKRRGFFAKRRIYFRKTRRNVAWLFHRSRNFEVLELLLIIVLRFGWCWRRWLRFGLLYRFHRGLWRRSFWLILFVWYRLPLVLFLNLVRRGWNIVFKFGTFEELIIVSSISILFDLYLIAL